MLNRWKLSIDNGNDMTDGNGGGIDALDTLLQQYVEDTPEDENYNASVQTKAKGENLNAIRQDKAKEIANAIKKNYNNVKSFTSEKITTLEKQNNELKTALESAKAEQDKIKGVVNTMNDDRMVNYLKQEEERLYNDPGIFSEYTADIFDSDFKKKVKDRYIHASAAEQRYISPKEALAIEYFDKVVGELKKYREKEALQNEVYGDSRPPVTRDRPDVGGLDDARQIARRMAQQFGL